MRVTNKESDVLRSCLNWLHLHGVFCWRNNAGVIPLPGGGFRRFAGLKGASDIIGILPLRVHVDGGETMIYGTFLGVETKRPGGKLRPEQVDFLRRVEELGGVGVCVSSVRELEEKLAPYL